MCPVFLYRAKNKFASNKIITIFESSNKQKHTNMKTFKITVIFNNLTEIIVPFVADNINNALHDAELTYPEAAGFEF